MCEVMSSSGVVVGVCGTWCAAWDGFFVPCPLFVTVYKRCGAVEEPRCVPFWIQRSTPAPFHVMHFCHTTTMRGLLRRHE